METVDDKTRLRGADTAARLELLGVMDPGDMSTSLAWIATAYPQVFDFALVRDCGLAERLAEAGDQGAEDEPYCATCGSPVGIFIGHGDAWRHYRGEGTVADPVELYDAGHAPEVAWRPAALAKIPAPPADTDSADLLAAVTDMHNVACESLNALQAMAAAQAGTETGHANG